MGYLHGNVCFPSVEAARQSACSGASTSWGSGSSIFTASCTSTDFTQSSMTLCVQQDASACTNYVQPYPPFPDCDFEGGSALSVAWFSAALLLAVTLYGFKHLIGLFDGRHEK